MTTELNILHLEDDVCDAELVRFRLEAAGLNATIKLVQSRAEFLAALEASPYHVILSDNKVPGFDGVTAFHLAREKWAGVPFIFISGSASGDLSALPAVGASACIDKADLGGLPEAILAAIEAARPKARPAPSDWYVRSVEHLVEVVQDLSLARDLDRIMAIVRTAARRLTGADGATFVLRDGDLCHYADEDAIAPLWKGKRFPMSICISGWAMLNRAPATIEDIYADPRIPADAYRPTFVKSLAMVPIRTANPVGAIGNYWAARHQPTPEEVRLLQALADSTSVAMENVQLYHGLEQKVAERTARLQMVNEELEAFSYSVSHDLQAPLRHVNAYARLLQEEAGTALSATGQRHLGVITDSARRMSVLIADLLEFSRMSRSAMQRGRVDMNELVAEVRREIEPEAAKRTIEWHSDNLPAVTGDRALLKQVWLNLLANALKFSRHRTPTEIRLRAVRLDGEVEFTVQDNGAGFDPAHAQKLFGVFERLHSPDEFEGTGIGLANVRRIVARHGGRTWAEGEVDRGATFHFTLPEADEQ